MKLLNQHTSINYTFETNSLLIEDILSYHNIGLDAHKKAKCWLQQEKRLLFVSHDENTEESL